MLPLPKLAIEVFAPIASVRVVLNEVPPWHFGAAGEVKGLPEA